MKGDFSRFSFDPSRHYSRVLLQQGRVQTDADWNEQGDIAAHRHALGLGDLIGRAGVPRDYAGFAIRAHGGRIFDGQQNCIEIREHHPLHFKGDGYTIEGWVKLAGEGRSMTIARADHERRGDVIGGFRLGLTRDGRLRFERLELREVGRVEVDDIEIDAWGDVVEEDIVIEIDRVARGRIVGNARLPVGRFCHVAAVCDEGALRLFVDGNLDAERPAEGGTPFNSSPMLVGCDQGRNGPRHHFAGVMDRLRLWRRALDVDEIRAACAAQARTATGRDHRWLLDGPNASHETGGRPEPMPPLAAPEIWIGAGRCYVAGVACENDRDVPYQEQPDCPGLPLPDRGAHAGSYLAYLDVWERVVSAIEDAGIREPALGGPDTAARSRTLAQVRLAPLEDGAEPRVPARPRPGSLRVSRTPGMSLQENLLYRIEIHDPGVAAGGPVLPDGGPGGLRVLAIDGDTVTIVLPFGDQRVWAAGQPVELVRPGNGACVPATVVEVQGSPAPGQCKLKLSEPPVGGEASEWALRPVATFKWSRDNAAWAFAVIGIDAIGTRVTIDDPNGMSDMLQPSHWVEIDDDDMGLCGRAAPICGIAGVEKDDLNRLTIVLDRPCGDRPFDQRKNKHPLLRRWDGIDGDQADSLGVKPVATKTPTTLAGGLHVRFGPGSYVKEDYWVVPMREHLAWPVDEKGEALAREPEGVRHGYAELALLSFIDSRIDVGDLRRIFAPLADAAPASAAAS